MGQRLKDFTAKLEQEERDRQMGQTEAAAEWRKIIDILQHLNGEENSLGTFAWAGEGNRSMITFQQFAASLFAPNERTIQFSKMPPYQGFVQHEPLQKWDVKPEPRDGVFLWKVSGIGQTLTSEELADEIAIHLVGLEQKRLVTK